MSIKGSPYARFLRALDVGKVSLVYAAAAELPRLNLDDGLRVLALMAEQDRARFDRAAVRWVARLGLERRLGIDDLRAALAACELLVTHPDEGRAVLTRLMREASSA